MVKITGEKAYFRKLILIFIFAVTGFIALQALISSINFFHDNADLVEVRVRIAHDLPKLRVASKTICNIKDPRTGKILADDIELNELSEVSCEGDGIELNGDLFNIERIRIVPDDGGDISVNGVAYRGVLDIINTSDGLDVVNRVRLEDYIKGVLPREVNHLWPFEALKAQAIASRSFALYQVEKRRAYEYDLRSSTFSQAYGGKSSEKRRTNRAVDDTRGEVLVYAGKVLPAYFHSCCGGHTEDAANLWDEDIPPLRGVKCKWCGWSPYSRWQARLSSKAIKKKLNEAGYDISHIDDIREGLRDRSGRLDYVSVRSGGKWFDIRCDDFNRAVGPRVLRSTNMHIKKYPFFYRFSGYGWGHGVGMCQWGAFGLAMRWKKADWILQYYYPGSHITNINEIVTGREYDGNSFGKVKK